MKPNLLIPRAKFAIYCVAIAAPCLAFASDLTLQKAPPLTIQQASSYPENLARYHFGADVQAIPQTSSAKLELSLNGEDRNLSASALLCDDPTTGYLLHEGSTTLLVSLANIENIQNISLMNEGARGSLTIAVSSANVPADSPEWHNIDTSDLKDGAILAGPGPGEAKYVKLTFDVKHSGRIAAFGVYAIPAVSDFTMPRPRKVSFENESSGFALIRDSYTDLHLRSRGLYASSGDLKDVNKMIDDQPGTTYRFAPGDSEPTAVIDLGRARTISRISAVYAAQPGSVDFYVLNDLPVEPNDAPASQNSAVQKISNAGQNSTPISVKLTEKTFAGLKTVGSVVNTNQGRASINFPATTGRYVMLKWHPASMQGEPFSVAQVAAFGTPHHTPTPQDTSDNEAGNGSASNDGKDLADAKSILDNKDIPAEGPAAEAPPPGEGPPPSLPGVPPFTFIPNVAPAVQPTSP